MQPSLFDADDEANARQRHPTAQTCAAPGCTNPKRRVQAAKYCDEHATSVGYVVTRTNPVVAAACYICDAPCAALVSTSIRLCKDHTYLRPTIKAWHRHHLDQTTVRNWLADPRCWICKHSLAWRFIQGPDFRATNTRIHVDHNHDCCKGSTSCGKCVRGLAHDYCNRELGHVEALVRRVGSARACEIIDALTFGHTN